MIPESMPVFTEEYILEPPSKEYEDASGRKSTVGWLKYLYLLKVEGEYLIQPTPQDYKDYKRATDTFRNVNNIPKNITLEEWEDKTTLKQQKKCLNNFRKAMGYTVEYDIK